MVGSKLLYSVTFQLRDVCEKRCVWFVKGYTSETPEHVGSSTNFNLFH